MAGLDRPGAHLAAGIDEGEADDLDAFFLYFSAKRLNAFLALRAVQPVALREIGASNRGGDQ